MNADVTVVMPVKNRAHLISRALGSVKAQSLRPLEVIAVDDGSTDRSSTVAEECGARVISLESSNGISAARNEGILAARGSWIAFLDSDDEWLPQHLSRLVAHSSGQVMVTAPGRSSRGRVLGNPWPRPQPLSCSSLLAPGDAVCTSGTMIATDVLREVGSFRPLARAEDLDLWIRVLERGRGLALAEPSVVYHEHDQQVSMDRQLMRDCFDQIMRDYADRPWMTPRRFDASYSRWHWDDLRAAQRARDVAGALKQLRWFATHRHARPALVELLRRRRASRRRVVVS